MTNLSPLASQKLKLVPISFFLHFKTVQITFVFFPPLGMDPERGKIVYASRIPPRPLEAWRLGGLEAGGSVLQVFLKGVIDGARKVLGKGGRPHFFR